MKKRTKREKHIIESKAHYVLGIQTTNESVFHIQFEIGNRALLIVKCNIDPQI